MNNERFGAAIAAIDGVNANDPTVAFARGRSGPKELLHSELVTDWVHALCSEPSEPLLLAARAHHLRRWSSPRSSQPAGRAGYLRWRKALHAQHAQELGELLSSVGYGADVIARAQALVRKDGLGTDPEVQVLEDALCLVFLETQLVDVSARLEPDTLARVLDKTGKKMSDAGRAAIPVTVVRRYLDGLARHDWEAVAATLTRDVERMGPYRDEFRGRDAYVTFLRETIESLNGYTLEVHRVFGAGGVVMAELSETVDNDGARVRTDESVVFDVATNGDGDAGITRVAVYLQTSIPAG